MDSLNSFFIYNREYAVIICIACKCVVTRKNLYYHLVRLHRHIPLVTRRKIISHADSLGLAAEPVVPTEIIPAIHGLHLINGYECHICQYLCGEKSTIERHCYREHHWEKSTPEAWSICHIQSFFPKRNYFKVQPVNPSEQPTQLQVQPAVMDSLIKRLKLQEEDEDKTLATMMEKELDKTENSPWMERTKWATIFAGKDMNKLSESIARPDNTDIIMMELWNRTDHVLRSCIAGVRDCRRRNWLPLLFLLNSNEQGTPNTQLFTVPQDKDTVKRYIGMWQRLMCFCIRTLTDENNV